MPITQKTHITQTTQITQITQITHANTPPLIFQALRIVTFVARLRRLPARHRVLSFLALSPPCSLRLLLGGGRSSSSRCSEALRALDGLLAPRTFLLASLRGTVF